MIHVQASKCNAFKFLQAADMESLDYNSGNYIEAKEMIKVRNNDTSI